MDVKESEWLEKATERIDLYLNRGGVGKGNEVQFLRETDLKNTIGVAMSLRMQDPKEWTYDELRKAENNELVYFKDDALKAINVVVNQIRNVCGRDSGIFLNVLPIELYYEEKLYEVPLFKIQCFENSQIFYIDNIGRSYTSMDDWYEYNKLPPGKMAYPQNLQLELNSDNSHAKVSIADTPSARPAAQAIQAVNIVSAVAGIGASIALLFVTGGLATPLMLTAVGSTLWSTTRAGYELEDKEMHGESVNPFDDAEARMLWLGITANLISFGTMGASWRLSSLALRGERISNAFRVFVNFAARTNIVVSGTAIIDTVVYMSNNYQQLTKVDVLMLIASIAFWTRGVFTYKSANTLVKEAQNAAFKQIGGKLSEQQAAELAAFRTQFHSDEQLLREYQKAGKLGISPSEFSQILIDGHAQGQIRFDGEGNLIIPGGLSFSIKLLSTLPQEIRSTGFHVLANLTPEQVEVFSDFRKFINNDAVLIAKIHEFGSRFNLNAREATERIINFWKRYTSMNFASEGTIVEIVEDSLVIGRAPPIVISELPELTSSVVQFLGEQLSRMDIATSRLWSSSCIPILLNLESRGMFTVCPVTRIVPKGRSVVLLNNQLQISIHKLNAIPANDGTEIFSLIGQLPSTVTGSSLPSKVQTLCVQKYMLRLECQRRDCVQLFTDSVQKHPSLLRIFESELQSFEMDRLYTFRSTVNTHKATPYMEKLMTFVAEMNPKNVSELVSYGEFGIKYVESGNLLVEQQLKNKTLQLPPNTNKAVWKRHISSEAAFKNLDAIKAKFNEMLTIVTDNNMSGAEQLSKDLSDQELIAAIREKNIKFGSSIAAAYHIYKHPVEPYSAYITRANEAIRSSGDRHSVSFVQDGDARIVRFEDKTGVSIVLEREGRVFLCTYMPKKH